MLYRPLHLPSKLLLLQVGHIISLMQSGIDVAIVTAAGYPGQPEKFEERVAGLLAAFRKLRMPSDITDRHVHLPCPVSSAPHCWASFHVLGS